MGQNKHSRPGVRHTPPARLPSDTIFLGVRARAISSTLIVSLTQPSCGGRGGGLPIVGFLNRGPTCKANSNALSICGCTLLPNTKTCIHSTPSVLLPRSWFIGPLCSLCQILTKDLTNKMLMHVKRNYLIGFVFEHSFQKYNVW